MPGLKSGEEEGNTEEVEQGQGKLAHKARRIEKYRSHFFFL